MPEEYEAPEVVDEGADAAEVEPEEVDVPEGEETGEEVAEVVPPTKTVPLKALEEERRKRQELEAKLLERDSAPQGQQQQKTLYDYYEENPKATIDYLNSEIARLSQEDPYTNAGQIEALRDQKVELRTWAEGRKRDKETRFNDEVAKIAPDYQKQRQEILKFAVETIGYTKTEFESLVNPAIVGESIAVKNLKLIKRQYDAANAGVTVKQKETRKQPNPVEQSTGVVTRKDTTIQQLKENALKTGSTAAWAKYIEAGGT